MELPDTEVTPIPKQYLFIGLVFIVFSSAAFFFVSENISYRDTFYIEKIVVDPQLPYITIEDVPSDVMKDVDKTREVILNLYTDTGRLTEGWPIKEILYKSQCIQLNNPNYLKKTNLIKRKNMFCKMQFSGVKKSILNRLFLSMDVNK